MSRMSSTQRSPLAASATRIVLVAAAVLAPLYVVAAIYIDPSLGLLKISGAVVLASGFVFLLWGQRGVILHHYSRLPTACRGACCGFLFWSVCVALASILRAVPNRLPDPFHSVQSLAGLVATLVAYPVGLGGWLFLWGDKGPPHPLLDNYLFNVLIGMSLTTGLGAVLFLILDIARNRRQSRHES